VLVAEDHPVNQKLMVALLTGQGHKVELAADGWEALAALARTPFDAVFMDVQMPVLDGLEATRRIRAGEAGTGRHVPIVALTAHAMKEHRQRCLDAGMDAYLSKPIDPPVLLRTLADVAARLGPANGHKAGTPVPLPGYAPVPDALPQPAAVPEIGNGEETAAVPVLDKAAALARVGGDAALLATLVGVFRDDAPKQTAEARAALASGDAARLRRAAHTLKGAASTFGAAEALAAAARLEELARAADLSACPCALGRLEAALRRLDAAFPSLGL
jgi:CheY-like chemotaxis protein/HPt (histidine-containing phosphotransfer) domain-containing protein